MNNWIECSEQMPDPMMEVLVFDMGGKIFICCHKNGYWRDFRVGSSRFEITHWQSLPKAP